MQAIAVARSNCIEIGRRPFERGVERGLLAGLAMQAVGVVYCCSLVFKRELSGEMMIFWCIRPDSCLSVRRRELPPLGGGFLVGPLPSSCYGASPSYTQ